MLHASTVFSNCLQLLPSKHHISLCGHKLLQHNPQSPLYWKYLEKVSLSAMAFLLPYLHCITTFLSEVWEKLIAKIWISSYNIAVWRKNKCSISSCSDIDWFTKTGRSAVQSASIRCSKSGRMAKIKAHTAAPGGCIQAPKVNISARFYGKTSRANVLRTVHWNVKQLDRCKCDTDAAFQATQFWSLQWEPCPVLSVTQTPVIFNTLLKDPVFPCWNTTYCHSQV